jgi:hypothetical protein
VEQTKFDIYYIAIKMIKKVIHPSSTNGYTIYMQRLENGDIVHDGGYCLAGLVKCTFCGIGGNLPLNNFFIKSKNGKSINYGAMCMGQSCAKKYEEDEKKYIDNFAFLQKLLNIEDRLSFITFAATCSKKISVLDHKSVKMLTNPMHARHILSFLSEDMDNDYRYSYCKDENEEKYYRRCTQLLQEIINKEERLSPLIFFAACHKKILESPYEKILESPYEKILESLKAINTKISLGRHKRIILSFLSKEEYP